MDFSFTPEQERFRQEIRDFLAKELTPEIRDVRTEIAGVGVSKEFSRKVGDKGWIGLAWPKEYGGQNLGHVEGLIYREEMILNGAPIAYHLTSENQMAPSIMMSGTDEQKQWFIPRIAKGELSFCIGYTESGVGSDLASLQTRAISEGDDYVINGSKIWNSGARHSEWMWLAARTDPQASKHRGISVFLLDLSLPGVTIRPITNMGGVDGFNLITFDDVKISKRMLVGEPNEGWYVVAGNLDFERSGIERVASNFHLIQEFLQLLKTIRLNGKELADNPLVRHRVAQMLIEIEVGKLLCYKIAWMQSQGIVPNREASISKVFGTETTQRNARAMMEILGLYGQLRAGSRYTPLQGRILNGWYNAISFTIAAGTSEIQRNVIAQRGLGLPRE
ncbi:acyl-CoA dehydrogenase family protein [Dehalococcoidia bacterium]|nr:acyl-CoA dehydrogenase family protein [Dehalococcoidia bacterium]